MGKNLYFGMLDLVEVVVHGILACVYGAKISG